MRRGPRRSPSRAGLTGGTAALLFFSFPLLTTLLLAVSAHAAVLQEIRVTPAGVTMAPGELRPFFATAVFSDGSLQDITAIAEWTTSDSSTARVSQEHGSRGLVEARDPGTVEIRAALEHGGSKTKGFTDLTVDAGPIVAIVTRPSSKTLDVGIPAQFKARAEYANGYIGDVSDEVAWSSSNPGVATVDPVTGLVSPLAVTDRVIIRARHVASGVQNSDEDGATKIKAAIASIDFDDDHLPPATTVLGVGMTATLDVYAYRVDGSRTNVTKDVQFTVLLGPSDAVHVYENGESLDHEAGDVEGLADGIVALIAKDPTRNDLTTTHAITVQVSGVLVALEIQPDPLKVSVGDERTTKVFGRLSTGLSTPDLRKVVDWSVDDPQVAIVGTESDNYGKVEGRSVGETRLRATEPSTGVVSAPAQVLVGGAITDVSIEPDQLVLGRAMMLPLRAYGNRSDGGRSNVTSRVTWEITPAGVATIGPGGMLETLSSGTASIHAILEAGTPDELASPEATLTVEGTLVGIRVTPTSLKVVRDQRRKAGVEGDLSTGAVTSDLREVVDWAVADPAVAIVGDGISIPDPEDPLDRGEVLGLDTGVTTLSAREPISGLSSTEEDNLRVQGDIARVEVEEANGGVVQLGTPGLYKARATFSDGSTGIISGRCEWSVDDEHVAVVDNTPPDKGQVTGLAIGGHTTVRIDCDGLTAEGRVEVAGEIVSVEVSPDKFTGRALRERRFRAAANYEGGARGDATELVDWSSTNPRVATVENERVEDKGLVRFLRDGETFIVAVAPSGQSAHSVLTVTGGIARLRVIPNTKTLRGSTGRRLKVIADLSDKDQSIVTKDVTWSSSDEDIARMSDREGEEGLVLAGSKLGTATITAELPSGESGTAEITVDTLLVGLSMHPERRVITVGRRRRVTARGRFDDGDVKSVTRYVEFISDDPAIADVVSFGRKPGSVTGLATGTTTIRAIDPTTGIPSDDRTVIEVVPSP